jgi:hypothetical protein
MYEIRFFFIFIIIIFFFRSTKRRRAAAQVNYTRPAMHTHTQLFSRQGYQHFDTSPAPPTGDSRSHRRRGNGSGRIRPFCVGRRRTHI